MLTNEVVTKLIADNKSFDSSMAASKQVMERFGKAGEALGQTVKETVKTLDGAVTVTKKFDAAGKEVGRSMNVVATQVDKANEAIKAQEKAVKAAEKAFKQSSKEAEKAAADVVKAQQAVDKVLEKQAKAAEKAAKEMEKAGGTSWASWITGANQFMELGQKAFAAMKAGYEAAKDGAKIMAAEQFFKNSGKDIEEYRRATKGLISDSKLMKKANMADSMGIDKDTFLQLTKVAQAAALKTGQDFEYMFDSIIVGTARSSRLLLDNLGIIVSVETANKRYAAQLGKNVEALSEEEKQTAFVMEVRRQSMGQLDEYNKVVDKTAEGYDRIDAQIENLTNSLKKMMAGLLRATSEFFGPLLQSLADDLNDYRYTFGQLGRSLGLYILEGMRGTIPGVNLILGDYIDEARRRLDDETFKQSDAYKKIITASSAQSALQRINQQRAAGNTGVGLLNDPLKGLQLPATLKELHNDTKLLNAVLEAAAATNKNFSTSLSFVDKQVTTSFALLERWIKEVVKHKPPSETGGMGALQSDEEKDAIKKATKEAEKEAKKAEREANRAERAAEKAERKQRKETEEEWKSGLKDLDDAISEFKKSMKAKDFDDVLGEVDKEIKDTRKEIADARNKQMQMFGGKAHAAEKEKAEKALEFAEKGQKAIEETNKEADAKAKEIQDSVRDMWNSIGASFKELGRVIVDALSDLINAAVTGMFSIGKGEGKGMLGGLIRTGAGGAGAAMTAGGATAGTVIGGVIGAVAGGGVGAGPGASIGGMIGGGVGGAGALATNAIFAPLAALFDLFDEIPEIANLWKLFGDWLEIITKQMRPFFEVLDVLSSFVGIALGKIAYMMQVFMNSEEGIQMVEEFGRVMAVQGKAIAEALLDLFEALGGPKGVMYIIGQGLVAFTNSLIAIIQIVEVVINVFRPLIWVAVKLGNVFIAVINKINDMWGGQDLQYIKSPEVGVGELVIPELPPDWLKNNGPKPDPEDENTEAVKENTEAIKDLAREFRNLPSGYKVTNTMYRAQNASTRTGADAAGYTPSGRQYQNPDGTYGSPPRNRNNQRPRT